MGRRCKFAIGAASCLVVGVLAGTSSASASHGRQTVVHYDSFSKRGGYTLADYAAKWSNPYGLGEMANVDTRAFPGGAFNVSAVPFTTGADYSVFDHLKYIAISNQTFAVPSDGSVMISSDIKAATPGTQRGRVVHGTYTATGAPYAEKVLQGQQAGAVMNVIDFATGQLFDWFVAGDTAFALIERLPSNVTGNTTDVNSPDYVGRSQMYTQIIKEVPVEDGVAHHVAIRYSRGRAGSKVEYWLDGKQISVVRNIGVPLDAQGSKYTGIYPSLGAGEDLTSQINSLAIGHGLFSLLDAFPFQHPEAPELSVSIPLSERLFGQGARASFDNFDVVTRWDS